MPSPDLEQQLAALRRSYAERLPARAAALSATADALAARWDAEAARTLQRDLHNLAGSGASYGFPEVSRAARAAEDACSAALRVTDPPGATTAGLVDAVSALAKVAAQVRP